MAQVIPEDDDFAQGAQDFGSNLIGYIGCLPYNSTSYGYYGGVLMHAPAYDGQHGGAAHPIVVGDYDTGVHSPGGGPTGFARREYFTENQIARASFHMGVLSGGYPQPSPQLINYWALYPYGEFSACVRIQGGSITDDTERTARQVSWSGYMFRLAMSGGGGLTTGASLTNWRFSLHRLVSGVQTELAGLDVSNSLLTQLGVSLAYPFTMSLTAVTVGSTVVLYPRVFGLNITAFGASSEIAFAPLGTPPANSVTDSDGARITGAGRCGFTIGNHASDYILSGTNPKLTSFIDDFEVRDAVSNVVLFRDEFSRQQETGGYFLSGASWGGEDSWSVQSDFTFDQGSYTNAPGATVKTPRLVSDSNRIKFLGAGSSASEYAIAQSRRPSPETLRFHRELTCEFGTAGTDTGSEHQRVVGIVLKAAYTKFDNSVPPHLTDFESLTGYVFAVHRVDDSGIKFTGRIYRYKQAAAGTTFPINLATGLLGFCDLTSSISDGSTFTIGFSVHPEADNPNPNSINMSCTIGGSAIAGSSWTVTAPTTVTGPGVISDSPGSAIVGSYRGEGVILSSTNTTKRVFFDDWEAAALFGDPTEDDPEGQASVALASEHGSPSATINDVLLPDFPFETQTDWFTQQDRFDSGHLRTTRKYSGGRRRYSFNAPARPKSERDALLTFYAARSGAQDSFYFTPIGNALDATEDPLTQVTVHFVEDSLRTEKIGAGTYSVKFTLEELGSFKSGAAS